MSASLLFILAAAGATATPAPVESSQPSPLGLRIEAIVDHGPTVDMTIRCGANSARVSYTKASKIYCLQGQGCSPSLVQTISPACGTPGPVKGN